MKNTKLLIIMLTLIFGVSIMNFTASAEVYSDEYTADKNTELASAFEADTETANDTEVKSQSMASDSEEILEDESASEDTAGKGTFFQRVFIYAYLGMAFILNMIVEFFSLFF